MTPTKGRPSLDRIKKESAFSSSNDGKGFYCGICERSFPRMKSLRTHQLIHFGERKHVCQHCHMTFIQSGHLNTHMLIHTGERPFVCPIPGCETRHRHANRKCNDHPEEKLIRDKNWKPKKKLGTGKIEHLEKKLKMDEDYKYGKKDIENNMEKSMDKVAKIIEEKSIQFQKCLLYTPRRPYRAKIPKRMEFKQKLDTMENVSETDPEKEPEKMVKLNNPANEGHQAAVGRVRVANNVDDEIEERKAASILLQLKENALIRMKLYNEKVFKGAK